MAACLISLTLNLVAELGNVSAIHWNWQVREKHKKLNMVKKTSKVSYLQHVYYCQIAQISEPRASSGIGARVLLIPTGNKIENQKF